MLFVAPTSMGATPRPKNKSRADACNFMSEISEKPLTTSSLGSERMSEVNADLYFAIECSFEFGGFQIL